MQNDDIAEMALVQGWDNEVHIAGIENNYILSKKYENLLGDMSGGFTSKFSAWSNGVTGYTLSGGIVSGTATETWAEVGVQFNNVQNHIGKTLLFVATAYTDSASAEQYKSIIWKFNGGTNLGNVFGSVKSIPVGDEVIFTQQFTVASGYDNLRFGIMENNTPLSKIFVKKIMVIDITDNLQFTPTMLDPEDGYWVQYPPAQYVKIIYDAVHESKWNGKSMLALGDSLTAALKWQTTVANYHDCTVNTHAKGGIGIVTVVDGNGDDLAALSVNDVTDRDAIILFIGMNERSTAYGVKGDLYPAQSTIWGKMQYVINTIYDLLTQADNLNCKILIVSPHCAGKYQYVDYDGYEEYPVGSGQTLEFLANTIKTIAQYNNCQCVDLWHDSGIGRYTWSVYTASATPTSETETIPGSPYPYNNDQLHLSDIGYERIGTLIAESINNL